MARGGMNDQRVYPEIDSFEMEFLTMVDLVDFTGELYEQATKDIESVQFDAFTFESMLEIHSLQFLSFKFLSTHGFFDLYHIQLETLVNLALEMQGGYSKENHYHCPVHVLDCVQGLHYLMTHGEIVKILKKHDVFASFIGTMIHDYEHPGYTNQFIVRTKHPLATRYSDISVLENHHLAAAFSIMFTWPKCNIMENMPYDLQL